MRPGQRWRVNRHKPPAFEAFLSCGYVQEVPRQCAFREVASDTGLFIKRKGNVLRQCSEPCMHISSPIPEQTRPHPDAPQWPCWLLHQILASWFKSWINALQTWEKPFRKSSASIMRRAFTVFSRMYASIKLFLANRYFKHQSSIIYFQLLIRVTLTSFPLPNFMSECISSALNGNVLLESKAVRWD